MREASLRASGASDSHGGCRRARGRRAEGLRGDPARRARPPLLDLGGGVIVKTATEYSASGTVYRTFSLPVAQVHAAVLETFRRAQITVTRDDASSERDRIAGKLLGQSTT